MLKLEVPFQWQLGNHPHEAFVHESPPNEPGIVSGLHSRLIH